MRVATLNLWGSHSPLAVRLAAIKRDAKALNADVFLFQEVYQSSKTPNTAGQIAKALGYEHVFFAASSDDGKSGNAIVSRRPITNRKVTRLTESRYQRILLSGTVDGIGIHTTHLAYRTSDSDVRVAQVQQILEQVAWYGTTKTILGGDFNAEPDSPEIRLITDTFIDKGSDDTWSADNPHTKLLDLPRGRRIDYLFSKGIRGSGRKIVFNKRTAGIEFPSDHFGLVANFGGPNLLVWGGIALAATGILVLARKKGWI